MCTYRERTVKLTASEIMALTPVLDKEISYQKTYAGKQTVAEDLASIKDKITGRDTRNIEVVNFNHKEEKK